MNRNYANTRELCKNISNIFSLPMKITYKFMRLVSRAIVHDIATKAMDKEDGKIKNFIIDAPFMCSLDVKVENGKLKATKVEFNDDFEREVIKAINTGESPLMIEADKALAESFKKRYNSLI